MNRAREKAAELAEKFEAMVREKLKEPATPEREQHIQTTKRIVDGFCFIAYDSGYAQGGADAHSVTRDSNADLEARI